jgi:hypothetical protein
VVAARPADRWAKWRRWVWLLDLILVLGLTGLAWPVRWENTKGDLWGDEADYALASVVGFTANRWDRSENPRRPDELVILRHYHPPLTVYVLMAARQWGNEERTLRLPFVAAGALTVGVTYLCGVILLGGRRELAVAAALLVVVTPLHIRASSHAIPWSFITLNLMALLWTLLQYAQSRRAAWIGGAWVLLGVLFALSEMFFPTMALMGLLVPLLFWSDIRDGERRKQLLMASGIGLAIALALICIFWPAGLTGGALKMVLHYMEVAKTDIPVLLGKERYANAPKWAYLYWYYMWYRAYFLLYATGVASLLVVFFLRKQRFPALITALFTAFFLAVAHRAHIIGPEYLAHCLPMLSLLAVLPLLCLSLLWRPLAWLPIVLIALYFARWQPSAELRDQKQRMMHPRWSLALSYFKNQWQPGDRIALGPQTADVPYWYLRHIAKLPVPRDHVQEILLTNPGERWMKRLKAGEIRYVIITSTFVSYAPVAPELRRLLHTWRVVYKSDEGGKPDSRLIVYERPAPMLPRWLPYPFSAYPLLWR